MTSDAVYYAALMRDHIKCYTRPSVRPSHASDFLEI